MDKIKLINISKDLYYEVIHLIELSIILLNNEYKNEILKHALLESLLIHGRNIYHFLFSDDPKKDDVIIDHFINSNSEWRDFKKVQCQSETLIDFKFRIGKEIAHLTYNRLQKTDENKYWNLGFVGSLIFGIDKFLELVPNELLHRDWEGYLNVRNKLKKSIRYNQFTKPVYSTH